MVNQEKKGIKNQIHCFKSILNPVLHYSNANINILDIFNNIKGKSGVYMWTCLYNHKRYIKRSINLRRRVLEYYNINKLLKQSTMVINRALLTHGY